MTEHLDHLIEAIGHTAEWRSGKAVEYPDDDRNAAAERELSELADSLCALPESHPLVVAYEAYWEGLADWDRDGTNSYTTQNEAIKAIGFRASYDDGAGFLRSLLRDLGVDPLHPIA